MGSDLLYFRCCRSRWLAITLLLTFRIPRSVWRLDFLSQSHLRLWAFKQFWWCLIFISRALIWTLRNEIIIAVQIHWRSWWTLGVNFYIFFFIIITRWVWQINKAFIFRWNNIKNRILFFLLLSNKGFLNNKILWFL